MKKTAFLFFTLGLATMANAQEMAKVSKVNGVEVYILAEPTRSYEVVMGGKNPIPWSAIAFGSGLTGEAISTKMTRFIKSLQGKAEKEDTAFDAVVYTNGKSVSAIRFTDEATEENDRLAEVQKIEGIPVFIMNEPLKKYVVENEKKSGINWTRGALNSPSIEEDVEKYARKLKKSFKKGEVDALIYSRGKKCSGIKFLESQ